MQRQWYVSRAGQVFGPVNDAQLMQGAAERRVLPTDQLNVAGEPHWVVANAIPWLFPAAAQAMEANLIPAEVVEEPVEVRVTCMACFRDVKVCVMPGDAATSCPKCRAVIELEQPEGAAAPSANQAAFEHLESKKDFKKRMQKKVADMQPQQNNAALGGLIGGIIAGG
jgi:hypothetical protein